MNMKYNLFLDDERLPKDCIKYMSYRIGEKSNIYKKKWIIVRNYKQFVDTVMSNGLPEIISFDHDLGDEHYLLVNSSYCDWEEYYKSNNREATGYDCAKWLVEFCNENKLMLPIIFIHSMNSAGCVNIQNVLNGKNSI